ncbi:MAG: hypothetical protein V2A70_00465, partial [Candidatus Omnitrophota bacterium]
MFVWYNLLMQKEKLVFIKSAVKPDKDSDQAYYLCFLNEDVLLHKASEDAIFPLLTADKAREFGFEDKCFIGWLNQMP